MSERNRQHYRAFNKLPVDPTLEWYEENLKDHRSPAEDGDECRLALLSLAVIGEDLEHEANGGSNFTTRSIRRMARIEETTTCRCTRGWLLTSASTRSDRASCRPGSSTATACTTSATRSALHASGLSWDEISRRNGLLVTTDCLHLNSNGAGMIADLDRGVAARSGKSDL